MSFRNQFESAFEKDIKQAKVKLDAKLRRHTYLRPCKKCDELFYPVSKKNYYCQPCLIKNYNRRYPNSNRFKNYRKDTKRD